MSLRLAMPVRVGLIVLVALFTGWLTVIVAFYLSADRGREAALPSADRLAALADVLERTKPAERAQLINALSGRDITVRIKPGAPDLGGTPKFNRLDAPIFAAIADRLAPRQVAILPQAIERRPSGPFASPINAVEFQIALSTGDTLSVTSNSPIIFAAMGLPLGFGAAFIGILIALITLILLNREFQPLSRLATAVDEVDPMGDPVELPPIRARSPELRSLVAAFARLQERLKVLIRGRMALIGGIQHDVRTFATRLRLRVDKIADPAERDRAVADISDMIHLLDDALLASRAGASELDEELIELAGLIRSEMTDKQEQAVPVTLSIAPDASDLNVLGDRLALRRIIANLVENALKYGHAAHLSLTSEQGSLILAVDDEGPGIPAEDRALLLEPFTRIEASRARKTGGSGLGLAVVASLLSAHHGTLEIGDAPTGGARVKVSLPVFRSQTAPRSETPIPAD